MRFLRALIAALMVAAGLASITATAAGAVVSGDVDVIVRANGIVDINGDNQDNQISICGDGEGSFLVIINGEDGQEYEFVEGLTKDLRINMRGGDDTVEVNGRFCELAPNEALGAANHNELYVPRDFRAILGSGNDRLIGGGIYVGDDMTVLGGSGEESVHLYDVWVEDRMDANTSSGESYVSIFDATFGRSSLRGGNQADYFDLYNVDLGVSPRILTLSGDDHVVAVHTGGYGRITANTGNGNDIFGWLDYLCGPGDDCCDDVECCEDDACCDDIECCEGECCVDDIICIVGEDEEGPEYYFNLIMGGGNDEAHLAIVLDPQDRIQGSGGNGDYLGFFNPGGARINGFEFFGEPDPGLFIPQP